WGMLMFSRLLPPAGWSCLCAQQPQQWPDPCQTPTTAKPGTGVTDLSMAQGQQDAETPISRKLEANAEEMRSRLGIGISFDIVEHRVEIGGRQAAFYFVDGFIKDRVTVDIFAALQNVERGEMVPNAIRKLLRRHIPYF